MCNPDLFTFAVYWFFLFRHFPYGVTQSIFPKDVRPNCTVLKDLNSDVLNISIRFHPHIRGRVAVGEA